MPGTLAGDPLLRLGIEPGDFTDADAPVRFIGKTRYLSGAKAVVTHSLDDTTEFLPVCLDVLDTYCVKATAFVSTKIEPIMSRLWPRLRRAIADGHEVGSHSRRHPCRDPDTAMFCFLSLTTDEIEGSRDDILENTGQSHVWTWAYPCGDCAGHQFVQRKIARAGYLAARAYPEELQDRHAVPDLQTYDSNPYAARYTQVVQKGYSTTTRRTGEVGVAGRTEVSVLNAKFDQVFTAGGIYSFVSHPQMLDYGRDSFYERHLAHISGRANVWYVPMGPLYAYRTMFDATEIRQLRATATATRFAVFNGLDPRIYPGSLTLEFGTPTAITVLAGGQELSERPASPVARWDGEYLRRAGDSLLVTVRPNTIVEFR
jgi:peptidoglycan/xylan/chitin deacetylase (PgdA/CDA1 family)